MTEPVRGTWRPAESGIARLHALYLSGALSPVDVVADHLVASRDLGARLNAFTSVASEGARAEAEASAARYRRGEALSVLDGVPLSVKDNIEVAGLATTCSSAAQDRQPATRDAAVVARLRSLGAVILGKTNLLEYAFDVVHPAFGPAHNPWAPGHSASGSSSGSAVAVAAGIGFGSLGTDTAGSVRAPAATCGTVGLKPSRGLLPLAGVVPLAPTLDHVGILARTVEDTRLLLDALVDRPTPSAGGRPLRLGRVDPGGESAAVGSAVDAVAARLGAEGVEIVPCRPFPWQEAAAAAAVVIAAEALEIHRSRLGERWPGYSRALRARVLAGAGLSGADYVRALRLREELRATWRRLLRADAVDAVLGPTLPHTAPVEGEAAAVPVDPDVHVVPLSVHALLGIPAISVPVALDREGLPIGVQVAAAEGDDGLVLDVAGRIESGRERWRVPPMAVDPLARTRSAGGQPPSRRDA